jgi:hypothetical protein
MMNIQFPKEYYILISKKTLRGKPRNRRQDEVRENGGRKKYTTEMNGRIS